MDKVLDLSYNHDIKFLFMAKVNLLKNYPQVKRNLVERSKVKSPRVRAIARKFDKECFDGDRIYGYGGFTYHPRFWQPVIPDVQKYYGLTADSRILDIGCAKGFMLYDFTQLIPGITISGIDISAYAINNSLPNIRPFVQIANATKLPFPDRSFDLVISINTIHNLPLTSLKKALREIKRVSKKHAFITVDAYRNPEEQKRMEMWNLTAKTILHEKEWERLFRELGYEGDYYWFTP